MWIFFSSSHKSARSFSEGNMWEGIRVKVNSWPSSFHFFYSFIIYYFLFVVFQQLSSPDTMRVWCFCRVLQWTSDEWIFIWGQWETAWLLWVGGTTPELCPLWRFIIPLKTAGPTWQDCPGGNMLLLSLLFHGEISLMDGSPWNLVQAFMVPLGCILMNDFNGHLTCLIHILVIWTMDQLTMKCNKFPLYWLNNWELYPSLQSPLTLHRVPAGWLIWFDLVLRPRSLLFRSTLTAFINLVSMSSRQLVSLRKHF